MLAAAYEWHNYGKSTIGNRSDIERVPIDNLQAFYKKYYQPDNVVLIVAGKFDEAKALALVEKYFGSIPKPTRKLDADLHRGAGPGRRADGDVLRRVGAVGVGRAWPTTSRRPSHADWAAARACSAASSRSQPERPAVQGPGRDEEGDQRQRAGSDNCHDPGLFFALGARADAGQGSTPSATPWSRRSRACRRRAVHRRGGRTRPRSAASGHDELLPVEQPDDGRSPELGVGATATGGCCSSSATASRR